MTRTVPSNASSGDPSAAPTPLGTPSNPRDARVGYLLRMYPRFSQTFVVNEILELERLGLDVRILSLRKPDEGLFHESVCRVKAKADYLPETVAGQVRKLWNRHGQPHSPRARLRRGAAIRCVLAHTGAKWHDLIQALCVLRWAERRRVRHIHVHFGTSEATVALLANLIGGPAYSLTLHAFDIFRANVDQRLLARKINASRFTVTVSEYNRRYLTEHISGVDSDRVRVNYNGIDLDLFKPGAAARDERTIFAVGRLIEKKGFVDLVHAVAQLRDAGLPLHCRIAGEGPDAPRLKQEIEQTRLQAQVELVGPLKQQQVREWMQRSACFVLPCVQAADGNIDALPTVLLEALACGCPSISTRLSGIPEIIEHGVSGLLVEPHDVPALARAIRDLLLNRARAENLGVSGRRRAEERFDIRRNARVMRDWLVDALVPASGRDVARKAVVAVSPSPNDDRSPVGFAEGDPAWSPKAATMPPNVPANTVSGAAPC